MKYGLIGIPLGHSFSKEIHAQLGNTEYELKEIATEALEAFLTERSFAGINVTIPHKQAVIPFLDGLSERASAIGAVNTIVNRNGKLFGDNTDFYGMQKLIEHAGLDVAGKKVAILGTGGTSKTVRAVVQAMGALTVLRVSRNAHEDAISYEQLYGEHADCAIIINTTPCGMYPHADETPIDISQFSQLEGVIDAIYNPLETKLVQAAKKRGLKAEGGLYMLVAQAIGAAELFFDTSIEAAVLQEVYEKMLEQKQCEAEQQQGKSDTAAEKLASQEQGDTSQSYKKEKNSFPEMVRISPSRACGSVSVPPSKSMAHRLLMCAGLAEGESIVSGIDTCEDVLATMDCLRALGATVEVIEPESDTPAADKTCACMQTSLFPQMQSLTVRVVGANMKERSQNAELLCRESGSTLRFFIPLTLLSNAQASLSGTKKLLSRPLKPYEAICAEQNIRYQLDPELQQFLTEGKKLTAEQSVEQASLQLEGVLKPGRYELPGNVSSQFITGLLFALPLLDKSSEIVLTTPVESKSYIDMTLQSLALFGVSVYWMGENCLHIEGGQRFTPLNVQVEGDYSNAAFLDAFNYLQGHVRLHGLNEQSLQGDKVYAKYFAEIQQGHPTLDLSDCPDLGPILFVLAACHNGAHFVGTERLAMKECDRGKAMAQELARVGVKLVCEENSIDVPGTLKPLVQQFSQATKEEAEHASYAKNVVYDGHNDHRIVMALSVLSSVIGGTISGAAAVTKSFPSFFHCLEELQVEVSACELDF